MKELLAKDEAKEVRQVGMIDAQGRVDGPAKATLTPRLPKSGLLPNDPKIIQKIVSVRGKE